MRLLSALTALFLLTASLQGSVSFYLNADLLKDQNGNPIPDSSLVMLVVSTMDGTFSTMGPGYVPLGSYLSDDDVVVYLTDLSLSGIPGVLDGATPELLLEDVAGWDAGDPLAVYWLPGATLAQPEINAGDSYGMYTDSEGHDGSYPWVTPLDGTSGWQLMFYTQDGVDYSPGAEAFNPAEAGLASLAAAPEPTRGLLFVLGALMMCTRRRRRCF
ncbi:PEP-CTERM sorting domain-containing protein [Roseimicrobium sp. ORNL1]|uniref:PEP-CTERM sorting domain-containing protein n=1 Tax=Roseimicrobium sp. ORNL1 TaxID=2711231 RepID=UPI0013E16EA9|nr:PEP-CTERM sorting domain-containing protein [Roseimicrobium sp. ORNL1]QIF03846.1 PEP-CTERM sorting domain-containing protein [Roseimicrobium sp. ORNL1]